MDTKLRTQVFLSNIGMYMVDRKMIIKQPDSKPATSDINHIEELFEFTDIVKDCNLRELNGRWHSDDIDEFLRDPQVNLLQLATDIKALLDEFIHFHIDLATKMLVAWIMGTYVYRVFNAYPYLHITGHAATGKTKLQTILSNLCYNSIFASNISLAAVFRVIEATSGVILLDEVELLRNSNASEYALLLNGGYKAGVNVYRVDSAKDELKLGSYDIYSPKSISSIGSIPQALSSRCIAIEMKKSQMDPANRVLKIDDPRYRNIRSRLYSFGLLYYKKVREAYEAGKGVEGFFGRQRELWSPLKAIEHILKEETNDN